MPRSWNCLESVEKSNQEILGLRVVLVVFAGMTSPLDLRLLSDLATERSRDVPHPRAPGREGCGNRQVPSLYRLRFESMTATVLTS